MSEAKEQNKKRSNGKGKESTRSFDGSALGPGAKIGPFRIEQELSRGAMGVVYLAHDTNLDRPVAIKSLPAELLEHSTARTRFEREAKVLASLNHPNVATIYEELQEAEGVGYLVLEYVPGQTLAERIAGARLKPKEALSVALQIAEAVAAAHENGIIHRDLKPGNIKLTPEGRIKVLDFGLAKALGYEAADEDSTITKPGRIMGTPAYMSPEQVRGLETDERCDIWSFGCVLYEMLTGKAPFEGDTVSDTLANILDSEPDWRSLPEATPSSIQVLLRRCLKKDVHHRLHDIADAAIEISETLTGNLEAFALPGEVAPTSRLLRCDVVLVALACFIAGVFIVSLFWPPSEPAVVSRTQILVPADKRLYTGAAPNNILAISPDSTRLVYVGRLDKGDPQLYMRHLDSLKITPIPGTTGAHNPFFSPDGRWVGFFADKELKKVLLAGGKSQKLQDLQFGKWTFGSWGDDGTIVISDPNGDCGLQRIPEDGGQAEILILPDSENDEDSYYYPQVLPGGKAILYSHVDPNVSRTSCIKAFNMETRKPKVVLNNASYATYVGSGHLIFVRDKVLMAVSFDVEKLRPTGSPVPLGNDNIGLDEIRQTPQIAISDNGTIIYVAASELRKKELVWELVWLDPNGIPESLAARADACEKPRVSPDGQQIAVGIRSPKEPNIRVHIYDVQGRTFTPLTSEGESCYPQWSPDQKRIAFWGSVRGTEGKGVYCTIVGATARPERLASEPYPGGHLHPHSWSQNLLACTVYDPKTLEDIWVVDTAGKQKPKPVFSTEHREYHPAFSPDGSWLAYVLEKSGQPAEIYVREFPDGGQQWIVPTRGATNPVWSRNGRELYYTCENKMMAVTVPSETNFPIARPLFSFSDTIVPGGRLGRNYDVLDDRRFLMVKMSDYTGDQLVVARNWFEELKNLSRDQEKNR